MDFRPTLAAAASPRRLLPAAVTAAAIAAAFWIGPVPQDPGYHEFADRRTLFGMPNFWNVATNLPFLLIGLAGLSTRPRSQAVVLRGQYTVFCIGIALVGVGSAYYHVAPSTPTLVWDRLSERVGRALLWPLVAAGVASIAYWYWSELAGRGDLRPYGVVQFLPMLLVPSMLLLFRGKGLRDAWLWATLGAYLLAKIDEHFDAAIYAATGFLSGHSLKHLVAALAACCALRAFGTYRSPARAL